MLLVPELPHVEVEPSSLLPQPCLGSQDPFGPEGRTVQDAITLALRQIGETHVFQDWACVEDLDELCRVPLKKVGTIRVRYRDAGRLRPRKAD